MADKETLREAINEAIPTSDLEWPGDAIVCAAVARTVVTHLGITREMVEAVHDGGQVLTGSTEGEVHDAMRRKLQRALTILLDLAEDR